MASSHFDQQLASLTQNVQNLATSVANISHPQAKSCGVCSMIGHMTDMCPSLQERGSYEQANALGGFQGQQNFQRAPRPRNDFYSNTYNPGWRNHPNFSYANNSNQVVPSMPYNKPLGFTQPRQPQAYQPPQATPSSQNSSLEELVKTSLPNHHEPEGECYYHNS